MTIGSGNGTPFICKRRPHEEPGPCPCKPAKVNQELNFLRSLKERAQCWTANDATYHESLLEVATEIPRALLPDEERRWLQISASQPRWMPVHWYSLLSFHTCMSSNEIRSLRIGNLNLESRILTVPAEGAKNRHRIRTIPIEDADALWAAEQLISRTKGFGSVDPQHYLFPFRDIRANRYVPSRPMTVHGIRKQWDVGNWIPNDPTFVAHVLKISSLFTPPPLEGFVSPMTWGLETNIIERFGPAGVPRERISVNRDTFHFISHDRSPEQVIESFRRFYGPTMNAYEAANKNGKVEELRPGRK